MSEIDWSKAPDWATHLMERQSTKEKEWACRIGGKYFDGRNDEDCSQFVLTSESDTGWRVFSERSQDWSGAGLPPVGTVCECLVYDSMLKQWRWKIGELIYYNGNNEFAVKTDGTLRWCDQFRPIRTQEQIEAEERKRALQEIEELITGYSYGRCAEILYQAGYRKQGEGKC